MNLLGWLKRIVRPHKVPFDIHEVESALGYHFNDPAILYRSLKHRSYSQTVDGTTSLSNERLEFLGDAVLNLVVSLRIYQEHPDYQEGELTKLRSSLVNKKTAVIAGKRIGLERFILLNDSEESSGGRSRTSIIADTFEAVIGAIFLDGGYEAVEEFVKRNILDHRNFYLEKDQTNYKSLLLELVQAEKLGHPVYRTVSETGPEHDKVFTIEVLLNGEPIGEGRGKSKKDAQQMSAKEGFERIIERLNSE